MRARFTVWGYTLSVIAVAAAPTTGFAGGFDRGGVNIDQLFDKERFSASAQVTHVVPRRTINNINRPPLPAGFGVSTVDVDSTFTVPRLGFKADITEDVACLATYSEPFGGDANYGLGNLFSPSTVEFEFDTRDYGLTCAYSFAGESTSLGDSQWSLILGGSYLEASGVQRRESLLFGAPGMPPLAPQPGALATFDIEDSSFGWRAGVAYEIPEIALRASIVYNSAYDLSFRGSQDNSQFAGGAVIPGVTFFPVSLADTEIPQAIDVKFQTGINETTLLFASFRWQDWSELDVIPVLGGSSPALALEPGYDDGYTVSFGIGKKLRDDLSAQVSLTWDDGTSTVSGTQSDTWTLAGGFRYDVNENVEWNIGGAVGILEGGTSRPLPNSIDLSNGITYDFEPDFIYALTTGVKYKLN